MSEALIYIIAVPLNLTFYKKALLFHVLHTCRMDNGYGSRQRLLALTYVRTALESPFSKYLHAAIPPSAALCYGIH